MKSSTALLLLFGLVWFSATGAKRHRFHYGRNLHFEERELQRTKRHLDPETEKIFTRIRVSPIKHSKRNKRSSYRPYVAGQVQDVRIEIKLKTYWKDELANRYTPQNRLLAGNVIDEISNALIDNRNFLEANVMKFRPSKWNTLADLSLKFFKTEVDPLHYLEGIVASGWISGLQVFSNYFKVLKIVNGNVNFPAWNYPKGLRLRLHPAVLTKVNPVKKVKHKVVLPATYKEIKISFQLYQRWNTLFLAKYSSPYLLLSGNIEQSLDEAFSGSPKYLNSQVLNFRESQQGQTIVDMYVRFSSDEVYPAQKLKILVSSGNVGETPVISDSLEIYEINNVTSDQPVQEPAPSVDFPKPHSDADINQSANETEKAKNIQKVVAPKETSEPIYPLVDAKKTNKDGNGGKVVTQPIPTIPLNPATSVSPMVSASVSPMVSDEAAMSMKLQRIKYVQQTGYVFMEHQSVQPAVLAKEQPVEPTKIAPQSVKPVGQSKNNVLEETSEPIYPKQIKIPDEEIPTSEKQQHSQSQLQQPQTSQQQQSSQYQMTQQQQASIQQQPQQQQQNQQSQFQLPQKTSNTPAQQQKPGAAASVKEEPLKLDKTLWEGLPNQVEGKLVMNAEQPISQALSNEIQAGSEKQLAQTPSNQTKTDAELERLQQDITEQQNGTNTTNAENSSQGSEENFSDSSDTPTLTKILYPQVLETKGNDANTSSKLDEKESAKKPQGQDNFLQTAENFLTEKQDNQNETQSKSADEEGQENEEEHKAIATMVAGVVSQQIKHVKAFQMQTAYVANANDSNKGRLDNVISEAKQTNQQTYGGVGSETNTKASPAYSSQQSQPFATQQTSSYGTQQIQSSATQQIQSTNAQQTSSNGNQQMQPADSQLTPSSSGTTSYASPQAQSSGTQQIQSSAAQLSEPSGAQQASNYGTQKPQATGSQQTPSYATSQPQSSGIQQPKASGSVQSSSYASPQNQSFGTQQQSAYSAETNRPSIKNQTVEAARNSSLYTSSSEAVKPQATIGKANWDIKAPVLQETQSSTTFSSSPHAQKYTATNDTTASATASYQQEQQQNQQQQQQQQQQNQQQQQQQQQQNQQQQPQIIYPQQQNSYTSAQSTSSASNLQNSYPATISNIHEQNKLSNNGSYNEPEPAWPLATPSTSAIKKPGSPYAGESSSESSATQSYEPTTLTVSTKSPLGDSSNDQSYRVHLKPHIYTPKVQLYQWPPVAVPIPQKEAPEQFQQISASESTMTSTAIKHSLHGRMILQQTWHPLLENKNSLPYRVLTEHIQHSIEQTYSSHHMQVSCKVTGLNKTPRNASRSITMEKVGVKFDLVYVNSEGEVIQTMKQVAKNGVISELLVFPDSLSLEDDNSPSTVAPVNPRQEEQTTSSSNEQKIVATSPIPVGNTAEVKPENNTKAVNYGTQQPSTASPSKTTQAPEPSFEFVTAPRDIPKSCEEIRDSGIGKSDGQYVLEARKGCHLSVICQNMEDKHPKEFLGGPNKREWEAYPFAALIKISSHDKENIGSRACLENSDEGRKLLEQIYRAKGKQNLPSPPWQTNIKRLLEGRRRRDLNKAIIVILEADPDELLGSKANNGRYTRSSEGNDADWGVL